jgi:uncharacterized membrane protein YdfJ with MMPL/SSD domain
MISLYLCLLNTFNSVNDKDVTQAKYLHLISFVGERKRDRAKFNQQPRATVKSNEKTTTNRTVTNVTMFPIHIVALVSLIMISLYLCLLNTFNSVNDKDVTQAKYLHLISFSTAVN